MSKLISLSFTKNINLNYKEDNHFFWKKMEFLQRNAMEMNAKIVFLSFIFNE